MPQTGPFVLRGDRRRAAWRMVGYAGGLTACVVAIWIATGMKTPKPLPLVLLLGVVAVLVLGQLLFVISRPEVVAHDKGIWVRKQSLWHPPSERFLPWEKVKSVDVVADRNAGSGADPRTNYLLRIVPRDVEAEYAAHPLYEKALRVSVSLYGAPYVVQLGYRDSGDVREMNIHWDEIRPKLKKVVPRHIPVDWITITI
jgi:hypothetical protein